MKSNADKINVVFINEENCNEHGTENDLAFWKNPKTDQIESFFIPGIPIEDAFKFRLYEVCGDGVNFEYDKWVCGEKNNGENLYQLDFMVIE